MKVIQSFAPGTGGDDGPADLWKRFLQEQPESLDTTADHYREYRQDWNPQAAQRLAADLLTRLFRKWLVQELGSNGAATGWMLMNQPELQRLILDFVRDWK